ncbi:MAG TPA: alcohol dehydrogenase catalytic domain-containing protein [Bryobacteraceae bacterium]|nr:alcohol dehydrogenase catalytic domain-containing protein [Bryobacteraceae bacterium]
MTAAELYDFRHFRMAEMDIPDPGPGEVQVQVKAVGICGSDVHYFSEGSIGDTPCVYPMVLGHEPTGQVCKMGPGVTGLSLGDRAALEPALYCYHCEFCSTGHHNVCSHMDFLSTPGSPGFFREYVNLPAGNLLPLPDNISFEAGTLFEPLAVILHSVQLAQLHLGETAAVFGAGPIGLLTVAVLKAAGAARVWAIDPIPHRRELALRMGADAVIDPAQVDPVRQILTDTGRRGVDLALDCATKGDTVNQCLDVARNAGRVVITGIPSELQVQLNFHVLRRKELALYTVRRSNREENIGMRMMSEQPQKFAPLVTHLRPLEKIQSSFELLEKYEDGVGKLVLTL